MLGFTYTVTKEIACLYRYLNCTFLLKLISDCPIYLVFGLHAHNKYASRLFTSFFMVLWCKEIDKLSQEIMVWEREFWMEYVNWVQMKYACTRRNATIPRKLKGAIQSPPVTIRSTEWQAHFSDYSVTIPSPINNIYFSFVSVYNWSYMHYFLTYLILDPPGWCLNVTII